MVFGIHKMLASRFFSMASVLLLCSSGLSVQAEQLPLEVLSAVVKDQKIDNAEVILQRNGAQNVVGRTNNQGQITLNAPFTDDGSNLLIIKKSGYSDLIVKCPCKDMTYAMSPIMKNLDAMRVVLSWAKHRADLDSHMIFPDNHIFYEQKQGTNAKLDVDDTDGYGPETITLQKKRFGDRYIYAVHDFTNWSRPNSLALSNSQASVFVYIGQSLVRTYHVPPNRPGNLWTVFAVTEHGDFLPIDDLSGVLVKPAKVHANLVSRLYSTLLAPRHLISYDAVDEAKSLNMQGEAAYHAGNIGQAIVLYRKAIDIYDHYGQAYSNLGLAYQKAGNTAEAIWANRRAITLASGDTGITVRANSYYNIARIYESAGQLPDALHYYQLAKSQKANPVYDKAIERVRNH